MAQLLAHPDPLLLLVAAVFVFSSSFRAAMRWRGRGAAGDSVATRRAALLPTMLRVIGAVLLGLAMVRGVSLFLPDVKPSTTRLLALALIVAVVIDAVSIFLWPANATKQARWRVIASAAAVAAFGVFAIGFVLFARSTPPNAVHVDWPVRGYWAVAAGGRLKLTNHHHNNPAAQNYAVDLVNATPGEQTEGQPVYAPITGTAVKVEKDTSSAEGCHVVLRAAGNIDVMMAHLQEGSVLVEQGSQVTSGQKLAACGDTGSATVAHLHIHAELGGRAVPLLFGKDGQFPIRGDQVRNR